MIVLIVITVIIVVIVIITQKTPPLRREEDKSFSVGSVVGDIPFRWAVSWAMAIAEGMMKPLSQRQRRTLVLSTVNHASRYSAEQEFI